MKRRLRKIFVRLAAVAVLALSTSLSVMAVVNRDDTGPSKPKLVVPTNTPVPKLVVPTNTPVSHRTSKDEPQDYGPYRIIPGDHPEAATVGQPPPPSPDQATRLPSIRLETIDEIRKAIPSLREPEFLPDGFILKEASGIASLSGFYGVTLTYSNVRRQEKGYGQGIEITQKVIDRFPIPIIKPVSDRIEEMKLGKINDEPAIFLVPTSDAPLTNPKAIRWVKGRVETYLTAYGFPDFETVQRVASSMK